MATSHAQPLVNPAPQEYTLWATGRRPQHAPKMSFPSAPMDSQGDLVSQPFVQGLKSYGVTGVDLFRNPENHPDAVGTILTHSAKLAKFFPAKGLDNQQAQFGEYIEKVSTFPGFLLIFNEQTGQQETSVNTDSMIKDIKNAYEGVLTVDVNKVVDSITDMANSIRNHSTKKADKSLFTQMAVTEKGGDLLVTIFYTTLKMELNQSGKKTYSSQSYYVNRSVFKVLTASLVTSAVKLNELLGDGSFDEWAKESSSPKGDKVSCFEKDYREDPKEV